MSTEVGHHQAESLFRKRFGIIPEIKIQNSYIENHLKSWNKRLHEFDSVIEMMNDMLQIPESASPDYHQDVLGLQKKTGINKLPSLSSMLGKIKTKGEPKTQDVMLATSAFNTIKNQMGVGGDWHWVAEITDPFQALSGLLIEGYGLALNYLYDGDLQVKRLFVKAFEEVLWTEGKDTNLLKDVTPWMVEERTNFPKKMAEEIGGLTRYGRQWGDFRVWGDDPSIYDESPEKLLKMQAWSQICPQPDATIDKYGLDWTLRRYAECNFWTGYIVNEIQKKNPELFQQLSTIYKRPINESAGVFEKNNIPDSHTTEFGFMGTPWGYALSRVLIEQFGRGDKKDNKRILKGLIIAEKTITKSKTPAELLARLANEVVKADAPIEAVLGHVFAIELKEEGKIFLIKDAVSQVKRHAPNLWKKYLSMSEVDCIKSGIIPSNDLLT